MKAEKDSGRKAKSPAAGVPGNGILMHKLEAYTDPKTAVETRRKMIERSTNTKLDAIGSSSLD